MDILVPDHMGAASYVRRSGSSIATAFTAGTAALLQEYGSRNGNMRIMTTPAIKNILISGCGRKHGITYPNREWGYGTLNLYNSIDNLRRG